VIGVSNDGDFNVPTPLGRKRDLIDTFGDGPGVEQGALIAERTGSDIIYVRCGQTTDGEQSAIDDADFAGTSAVTLNATPLPIDTYDVVVVFTTGGTIGTPGIVYKESYDGGRNFGPRKALGTANNLTVAGACRFNFAAGTVVTGDVLRLYTIEPIPNGTDVTDAMTALLESNLAFDQIVCAFPISATLFDTVDAGAAAMVAAGKNVSWIGSVRMPTLDDSETDAAYQASLITAFSSKATTLGQLCAGACEVSSSVSGRKYRRPPGFVIASREAGISRHENGANPNLGSLNCSIRDDSGNPKHHDEDIQPGLDDARFTTLRTIRGLAGVYPTRARCFATEGSDFYLYTYRRVMNRALDVAYAYFVRRLNKAIRVNKATGRISEEDHQEIQGGFQAALDAVMLADPMVSGVTAAVSKSDNLLSTRTLTVDFRLIPLAFPDTINVTAAFTNPALSLA
jgi:hypothetical protein